jgi:phosphate transport system protein
MTAGHTVAAFDAELKRLHTIIETMGRLAEAQLVAALEAVSGRDAGRAGPVVKGDAEIDRLEHQVESLCFRLLALRQPVASDLREVVAALKIAANLERIGDFASSIAKRAVTLAALPAVPSAASLTWIGQTVVSMLSDVQDAYRSRDVDLAMAVRNRDGDVDTAYTALFRELLTYMMESPQQITGGTHLLFVAKAMERIGDHTTNISENICFLVRGRQPAGDRPKEDLSSFTVVAEPGSSLGG